VGEPVGGGANRSGSLAVPTEPPTLQFSVKSWRIGHRRLACLENLPQDGLEDSAVAIVVKLDRRIDADGDLELL